MKGSFNWVKEYGNERAEEKGKDKKEKKAHS